MTLAQVQTRQQSLSADDGTFEFTYLLDVEAGSLLMIGWSIYDEDFTGVSISDSLNGAWTELYDNGYQANDRAGMAYFPNSANGTCVVTITLAGAASAQWASGQIVEASDSKASSPVNQNNENTASGTSWTSNSITTDFADCYQFGAMAQDEGSYTLTQNTPTWTELGEEEDQGSYPCGSWGERIVSATETNDFDGTISSSATYWAGIVAFEEDAAAADFVSPIIPHFRVP